MSGINPEFEISSNPGFIRGAAVRYLSANSLLIEAGQFYANGKELLLPANFVLSAVIPAVAFENIYIVVKDSASSGGCPAFSWTTTEPEKDTARDGWYVDDDRALGVATSLAGSATIPYFDTVAMGEKLIRNVTGRYSLALNQNMDTTWQTPNVSEASVYAPISAAEIQIQILANRTGASAAAAWASNEFAAPAYVFDTAPGYRRGSANINYSTWGALGASRNIKVAGYDQLVNDFAAWANGYGYKR